MPVVATVESGSQFARRRHVGVAVHEVADLVWVFLVDTGKSEARESFRRRGVEFRRRISRHNRDGPQQQESGKEKLHRAFKCRAPRKKEPQINGANGMSDIEGKAAMGSGERGGSRTSFNTDLHR